jgi:hypothetical protein
VPVTGLNYQGQHYDTANQVFGGNVTVQGTLSAAATGGTTQIGGANASYALSQLNPGDIGLKAWSFPNYLGQGTASAVAVAGSVYLSAVHLTGGVTYSTIYVNLIANGGGAAAGSNFAGLYNSSGARVATTADIAGALGTTAASGTTGYISLPLSASYTPPSGGLYWVACEFNFANAGSYPKFACLNNYVTASTSAGITATGVAAPVGTQPFPYSAVATTSATALPTSFALGSAGTTGAYVYWSALA